MKPLHEVVDLTLAMCIAQTEGKDVAIPYLQGDPGGGKTASIYAEGREADWDVISTHFALKMLEELGGIPQFSKTVINGEKRIATEWSFPDIMKVLYLHSDWMYVKERGGILKRSKATGSVIGAFPLQLHSDKDKDDQIKDLITISEVDENFEIVEVIKGDGKRRGVVWMLDDMHLCGPVHMAMLYELLTERKLREYYLPKNVAMCLCGNTSQKAGAKTTFSAIVNRCALFPVFTDFGYWKNNFAIVNGVHSAIISFLGNQTFQKHFHEKEEVDKPWASPRAWTRLSTIIKRIEEMSGGRKLAADDLAYLAAAHVGKTASGEFVNYYKIFTQFDMKKIFEDYKNFGLPTDPTQQYAVAYAIITEYSGVTSEERKAKKYPAKLAHFINCFRKAANNVSELGIMMLKELSAIEQNTKKPVLSEALTELVKIDPSLVHNVAQDIITYGK